MARTFMLAIAVMSATVWTSVLAGGDSSKEIEAKAALLKADDWETRKGAVEDLAAIGGEESGKVLLSVLQDAFEEEWVREAAAAGLAKNMDKRAIAPLIEILKTRRAGLLVAAAKALAELGDDQAVQPIVEAIPRASEAEMLQAVLSFGDKSVDPLLAVLQNRSNANLYHPWAIAGLGRTGSPRAVLPVAGFLKHPRADIRAKAAVALLELHDDRAVRLSFHHSIIPLMLPVQHLTFDTTVNSNALYFPRIRCEKYNKVQGSTIVV
ncbi:MAG: HEAT repeat domain-containing protein [Planctomycetaceae bacterium]|nr:HEAT repeat domain-containing protein [Planctomycetaceae bacterium]